jgi:hypothetical protein
MVVVVLAVVALAGSGCSGNAKRSGGAAALKVGVPVTVEKAIVIHDLAAAPEKFVGQTVRLEGSVAKVCQGMGCWAEVKAADGSTFLARSLDESVLLPTDCAGKRIVVQGVVTEIPAEVTSEPQPADHECPRPSYLVATQGVELF